MFIGVGIENWGLLLFVILVSVVAGISLSLSIPWTLKSYKSTYPLSFGIALSPFILGASSILSLGLFRGNTHNFHLITVILLLICTFIFRLKRLGLYFYHVEFRFRTLKLLDYFILLGLILWLTLLLINVLFFPITKNDSLEYVTVGKILYQSNDLLSYPVIDSLNVDSGFYAPWTHPPLYVALIYIMDVIQSESDYPIFAKLISPWFAIGSVLLMYEIGTVINRTSGLITALIFLSCPLYFLGVSDSLIDSLPVSGMILILCSIIFFKSDIISDSLVKGSILGISLWTHSEAILFVPLMCVGIIVFNGVKSLKHSFWLITFSFLISFIIAFYPYARNYVLFKSIISDTPLIFSLMKLDWAGYFQINRGYFSLIDKMQYGLLKGWFVLDAYSFIYWLMLLGILFFICNLYNSKTLYLLCNYLEVPLHTRIDITFFCIFSFYILGVLLSILLDIDLMIRNERYLLITLPIAAYFAGKGAYQMLIPNPLANS